MIANLIDSSKTIRSSFHDKTREIVLNAVALVVALTWKELLSQFIEDKIAVHFERDQRDSYYYLMKTLYCISLTLLLVVFTYYVSR